MAWRDAGYRVTIDSYRKSYRLESVVSPVIVALELIHDGISSIVYITFETVYDIFILIRAILFTGIITFTLVIRDDNFEIFLKFSLDFIIYIYSNLCISS